MKKLFAVLLVLVLLTLTACDAAPEIPGETPSETVTSEVQDETKNAEHICVDIAVNQSGFYSLFADAELQYHDGEIDCIYITNPALLAFQVSEQFGGGVYLLNLDEGEYIVDALTEIANTMKGKGEDNLAEQLEYIINTITESGPITNAST